jgi:hypothetical protein
MRQGVAEKETSMNGAFEVISKEKNWMVGVSPVHQEL